MPSFIIDNKLYDTDKMDFICNVRKRYPDLYSFEERSFIHICGLYRSKNGRYLLVRHDHGVKAEAIEEAEVKQLLMTYDLSAYCRLYGIEEA